MIQATEEQTVFVTRYHDKYDPDIIRLCDAFSKESLAEYGLEVTNDRLSQMISVCKEISFFLLVPDPVISGEHKVVGLIAGMAVNNLTNNKAALQEVIWYVDKEYRKNGRILLQYFEEAAKAIGCSQIVMALMCNSGADKLGRFYERNGYKPFEVQYMKEIEP